MDRGQDYTTVVFDPELRYFLGARNRRGSGLGQDCSAPLLLDRRTSIKDLVEALGPPHTEIGALEVDGEPVGFDFLLDPTAPATYIRVRAHPVPRDVFTPTLLRPQPLDAIRFAVDVNAGKLAANLRMLGFDAAYTNWWTDADVAELAEEEQRIVLSKDRGLLKRSRIVFGCHIHAEDPEDQMIAVLRTFGLHGPYAPFTRCIRCNAPLRPVAKQDIVHLLEPLTKKFFTEFSQCPKCGKVYWAGSHHAAALRRIKKLQQK